MITPHLRKAVFLDRDGVLNVDLGYTYRPGDLRLVDGAIEGLEILLRAGFLLVLVTNQSGVARGFFSMEHVHAFHETLVDAIREKIKNFRFDAIMICPHHPSGKIAEFAIQCECRKPGTKLILDASQGLHIDLTRSWLVGDKASDIDCAIAAGIRGIQVIQGGKQYPQHKASFAIVPTLREAAVIISGASL